MPISQFLGNSEFDPEIKRIMGLAFEMTRLALGLADRGDIANELIAKRIIELAKAGELNPDVLCEAVVKELRRTRSESWRGGICVGRGAQRSRVRTRTSTEDHSH